MTRTYRMARVKRTITGEYVKEVDGFLLLQAKIPRNDVEHSRWKEIHDAELLTPHYGKKFRDAAKDKKYNFVPPKDCRTAA